MCRHCAHKVEMAKVWRKSDVEHRYAMMQAHMDIMVADMIINNNGETPPFDEQITMAQYAVRTSRLVALEYYNATDDEIEEVVMHALTIEQAWPPDPNMVTIKPL